MGEGAGALGRPPGAADVVGSRLPATAELGATTATAMATERQMRLAERHLRLCIAMAGERSSARASSLIE